MKFELASEWPLWLVPLCLFLGILLGWVQYYFREKNAELDKYLVLLLFILRSSVVALLSFLLIAPFIISKEPLIERPIIIYAEDHSQSIIGNTDSLELQQFQKDKNLALEKLSEKFEVHRYSFGESLREANQEDLYSDRLTNMSEALNSLEDRYENRNVALTILSSDGVFNRGENPLYSSSNFGYPVYTIALGDTSQKLDAFVVEVDHNQIAFLNNTFSVEVNIGGNLLNGKSSNLLLKGSGGTNLKKPVYFDSDQFNQTFQFELSADNVGLQKYEVRLEEVEGEVNVNNNSFTFFVEILENQQRVLILASAPHPDVAAINNAINSGKNYRSDAKILKDYDGNFEEYDLLILHQIPTNKSGVKWSHIENSELPIWYILGKNSSIPAFNERKLGLEIKNFKGSFNESFPILNEKFQYFSMDNASAEMISQFPPLLSPFGSFEFNSTFSSLFLQQISNINTSYPMIGFSESEGSKTGFTLGEGIWRWKLYDYRINENNEYFNGMIQKIVQFLSIREDRSRFRVSISSAYFENESVSIKAEYYDKSFELSNQHLTSLELVNQNGNEFQYQFLPSGKSYRLDLGRLPEGEYSWKAFIDDGMEKFEKKGLLSIKPLQLEYSVTSVNHSLLYNLSSRHGGKMILPGEMEALTNDLLKDEKFKPVIHYQEKLKELISLKWLFFLALVFLSAEWFARKWFGLT